MPRVSSFPYLLARAESISLSEWSFRPLHFAVDERGAVPSWDPATDFTASISGLVNALEIVQDCGLSSGAWIRLETSWHSDGTGLRGSGDYLDFKKDFPSETFTLRMAVDSSLLARSIELYCSLILVEPGEKVSRLAPRRPGSLLWRESKKLLLEGQGARFPMELVEFRGTGWYPDRAGWFLDWDSRELSRSAMGGVRLYLNASDQRVNRAATENLPEDRFVRDMIAYDTVRALTMEALRSDDLAEGKYKDGELGSVIVSLLVSLFPTRDIASLKVEARQYPQKFETKLQSAMREGVDP